jgi:hypothetical protein
VEEEHNGDGGEGGEACGIRKREKKNRIEKGGE